MNRIGLDPKEALGAFTLHVAGDWEERLTPQRAKTLRSLLQKATVRRAIASFPTANISNDEPPPPDFYAVFDFDEAFRIQELQKLIPSPLAFFEELLAWRRQGGVRRIRLVIKKSGVEDLFTELALSDGEFLYIGRYALLLMLREVPEILVLLDEPETHFNDHWKIDLVRDIYTLINPQSSEASVYSRNEVIIATHSGLTLTDADPRQVYKFVDREGKIFVEPPPISPFAANLGDISRTFSETERAIGNYANERIEEALQTGSREEIERLVDEVVGPGFSRFRLLSKLSSSRSRRGIGRYQCFFQLMNRPVVRIC